MSAPPRVVPHIWELRLLILDMMYYDIDTAAFDPDELDEYVEDLYGAIKDAKELFIDQIGGYTL